MASLSASTVPFGATLGRPVDGDAMFRLSTCLAVSRCVYPLWPCTGWHESRPQGADPLPAEPPLPAGPAKDRLWGLLSAGLANAGLPPEIKEVLDGMANKAPPAEEQVKHRCKYRIWWTLFNKAVSVLAAGNPPRTSRQYEPLPPYGAVYPYPSCGPLVLDSTGGVAAMPMDDPSGLLTDGWISGYTYFDYGTMTMPQLGDIKCHRNQYVVQGGPPILPTMADEDFDDFFGTTDATHRGSERSRWREFCSDIGLGSWLPAENDYRAGLTSTATYKEALGGGGAYAPPWRGSTGPLYWAGRSPEYLKQLSTYWEGVGDEWTEKFPYHGLAALSSVLEHVESRAIGYGTQLAASCPPQSPSDPGYMDVCSTTTTVRGIRSNPSVTLHYSIPADDPSSDPVPCLPSEGQAVTLDLTASPVSETSTSYHDEHEIVCSDERTESLVLPASDPVVASVDFEIHVRAELDGYGRVCVSEDSGWSPSTPAEQLGDAIWSHYIGMLSGDASNPAATWDAACRAALQQEAVTVEAELAAGVEYAAELRSKRYGGLRQGTFAVPAVSKRLVDAGVASLSHVFFGKTWLSARRPDVGDVGYVSSQITGYLEANPHARLPHACIWKETDPRPYFAFDSACRAGVAGDLEARASGLRAVTPLGDPPDTEYESRVAHVTLACPTATARISSPTPGGGFGGVLRSALTASDYIGAVPVFGDGLSPDMARISGSFQVAFTPGSPSIQAIETADGRSFGAVAQWRAWLAVEDLDCMYEFKGDLRHALTYVKFAKGRMS